MRVSNVVFGVIACCFAMAAAPISAQSEKQNLYQMSDKGHSLAVEKFAGAASSCSFSMSRATKGLEFGLIHNQNAQGGVVTMMVYNPLFPPGGVGNIRLFRFVSSGTSNYFDQAVEIKSRSAGFFVANGGMTNTANQKPFFDMVRTSGRLDVLSVKGVLLTQLTFPDAAMKQALSQFDGCVKSLN